MSVDLFFCLYCFNSFTICIIYSLSLHDALPISDEIYMKPNATMGASGVITSDGKAADKKAQSAWVAAMKSAAESQDRKSTRLNSSHVAISYAVFCLKKKKIRTTMYL